MNRIYRQAKRAEAQEQTRERIVRATMALHLEKGVATTSYSDVAERAGVGAATVYRHFPAMGDLVDACGAHIRQAIEPPRAEYAPDVFAGIEGRSARIARLVQELDAFYARAAAPLWSALRDQDRVPELAVFVEEVRAGVVALAAAALQQPVNSRPVIIATAVASFVGWQVLSETGIGKDERLRIMGAMIEAALRA
ncbi:MAG: TetR/AcrR family transcriptional regulator [Rhizobiaceae bacterium]|nr:TetR/AcrR family transcriptional regulator [Rhizobiaceae bacterium]